MTAETLKPFLANTNLAKNSSIGFEKSSKFFKNHKNLLIFCLTLFVLMGFVAFSILQIWNFKQINKLQTDVDKLKNFVDEMRKHLGFDLFELNEFENDYQRHFKEDIGIGLNGGKGKDRKNKVDMDLGTSEEDDDSEDEEIDIDDNQSGWGMLDDDYGVDDEQSLNFGENLEEEYDTDEETTDDNNIYKDMKMRKTRSITGVTDQGIPILNEPYIRGQNRTRSQVYRPHDFMTKTLLTTQENDAKMKLTWNNRNSNSPRREFSQEDKNSLKFHNRHHHNLQDSINRLPSAGALSDLEELRNEQQADLTTKSPSPIYTRRSRVMHSEDKTKAFRQVFKKDEFGVKYQEQRKAPEQYIHKEHLRNPKQYNPRKTYPAKHNNMGLRNAKHVRNIAIHYHGDSSSYVLGRHHNYEGNGKVKLNKNEYINWAPADWVKTHSMDRYFSMDTNGILTVKVPGLYFIYAQVFYSDDHDTNGYVIEHNTRVAYQCTTMTHTVSRVTKTNTCYTSGLLYLKNGDKIQFKDIGNYRSVLLEPSKSFFGLIKVNILPHVPEESEEHTRDVEQFHNDK